MSMIEALSSAGIPRKEFTRMLNVTETGSKENKTPELKEERKVVKRFGIKIDGESLRRFCINEKERQTNQLTERNSETEQE